MLERMEKTFDHGGGVVVMKKYCVYHDILYIRVCCVFRRCAPKKPPERDTTKV